MTDPKQEEVEMPPELTDEEEKLLDSIWDALEDDSAPDEPQAEGV